jgi:outer membrane immunogenic protein
MKKKLAAAALFFATTGVMAQSAFEGFYGQIGIGYENNSPSTSSYSINVPGSSPLATSVADSSKGSFSGSIGLGYGLSINNDFLLTLGVDYSPLTAKTGNTSDAGISYNYKISNRTNIFVAPGYVIDKDKLAYVKAGYSMQTMKVENFTNGMGSNPSNTLNGYVLGLGYKQLFGKNIYIFGEGNYYNYGSKSYTNDFGAVNGTDTFNAKATAYQFLLGVGYKF